jgi:hypothetical protein
MFLQQIDGKTAECTHTRTPRSVKLQLRMLSAEQVLQFFGQLVEWDRAERQHERGTFCRHGLAAVRGAAVIASKRK